MKTFKQFREVILEKSLSKSQQKLMGMVYAYKKGDMKDASDEVKDAFEEEVNIFGNENFDSYVPTGSAIDVGQRRVLVAAGAAMTAIGATVQGAGGSSGGSKGGRKVK